MKPSEGLKDDDLGKLISSHRTGLFRYWWCFLLSGCFFVMLVIFWKAGRQRTEDAAAMSVILGILFALSVIPLLIAWYYSINEAQMFERGFVYTTRRSTIRARWEEISDFYKMSMAVNVNGLPTPPQHRFSVRLEDGTIVRFSPRLENVQEMGSVLLEVAEKCGCPVHSGVPYGFSRKPAQQ